MKKERMNHFGIRFTKKQWAWVTKKAAKKNVSASEIVRIAVNQLMGN